ncbi:MAG: DUF1810 domain-containing protein [Opitutus sp.]
MDPNRVREFIKAQESVYADVVAELKAGRKTSHWMWFIFPQLAGLGSSSMARRFALSSVVEARGYAEELVLGQRLRECTRLVIDVENRSIHRILGSPDDLKFRSSMTLFSIAVPEEPLFSQVLQKYYGGEPDPRTIELLQGN